MNSFLIPANTKSGTLIFNMFTPFDLILFAVGVTISLILVVALEIKTTLMLIIVLLPALITGFLVIPIPNYHNMLVVLSELIIFFTNRQKYIWRGWCVSDEKQYTKK